MIEILITGLLGGYLCFLLLAVSPGLFLQRLRAVWKILRMAREYNGQHVYVHFMLHYPQRPLRDLRLYGPCRAPVARWLMLELAWRHPHAEFVVLPISGDHLFHCPEPLPAWRLLGWRVPGQRVHYRVR